MSRTPRPSAILITALVASCGAPPAQDATSQRLRAGVGGYVPSQVPRTPARYVPIAASEEDNVQGGSSEGGTRVLTAGVRLVTLPGGGVLSSSEPLPAAPLDTPIEVPARMGGGFLFRMASVIYRSDDWLGAVRPIFAQPPTQTMSKVVVGLDRVYVKLGSGAFLPIDPVTGKSTDLGTFPRSPAVGDVVTLDGWRAAAIVDARGVVVTENAGATWTPVPLPIEPKTLERVGDAVAVSGPEPPKNDTSWFEVSTDGRFGRLARSPDDEEESSGSAAPAPAASPGPFGARPLVAAVEDGWPLTDGTVLLARDGMLGRVRTTDGTLVEVIHDAFPMKPARCHPFSLARKTSPAAFGFECGEPRGTTELYAFDPRMGALVPLRHFDTPRVVVSSGNGAIFVRGGCAADAPSDDAAPGQQSYCVLGHDNVWTDFVVRGDIGAERIVVLTDGRKVVLSPPQGSLSQARLTILDKTTTKTVPIAFTPDAKVADSVNRALRSGAWLEGFQERKPGVISGWVLSGVTAVGIEIKLDGSAKHGEFIPDLGAPVLSGEYGMSWSGTVGHETTDGGITWRQVNVPPALPKGSRSDSRACGPIGCETAGWLRIGWGANPPVRAGILPTLSSGGGPSLTPLQLHCEVVGKPATAAGSVREPTDSLVSSAKATGSWNPFYASQAPKLAEDDAGYGLEATAAFNNPPKPTPFAQLRPLAHLYAWGPKGIDLGLKGRTMVRWVSPFESSSSMHSTQLGAIPHFIGDPLSSWSMTPRQNIPLQGGGMVFGEDGAHALWMIQAGNRYSGYGYGYGQGGYGGPTPVGGTLLLEADRGPTEVKRTDGEPIAAFDAAVHAGGRWYLATAADPDESPAAVVWEVEAGIAHELVRLPRADTTGKSVTVGMARSADDRSVGVMIIGQPGADRFQTDQLWVVPIDLATGSVGEPQVLGALDITNGAGACERGAGGWVYEAQWRNSVRVYLGPDPIQMTAAFARFHVSPGHACVERVATSEDVGQDIYRPRGATLGAVPSAADKGSVEVTVAVDRGRQLLRCSP